MALLDQHSEQDARHRPWRALARGYFAKVPKPLVSCACCSALDCKGGRWLPAASPRFSRAPCPSSFKSSACRRGGRRAGAAVPSLDRTPYAVVARPRQSRGTWRPAACGAAPRAGRRSRPRVVPALLVRPVVPRSVVVAARDPPPADEGDEHVVPPAVRHRLREPVGPRARAVEGPQERPPAASRPAGNRGRGGGPGSTFPAHPSVPGLANARLRSMLLLLSR
mmetsp:Transcript_15396/g.35540  ORF Transcript_15396/g.35540 Transcript_15396/m.35540 type:complete len:223 (-) Transcript_15396:335-1003(-)